MKVSVLFILLILTIATITVSNVESQDQSLSLSGREEGSALRFKRGLGKKIKKGLKKARKPFRDAAKAFVAGKVVGAAAGAVGLGK